MDKDVRNRWIVAAALMLVVGPLTAAVTPAVAQRYVHHTPYCVRAYDGAMECAYYTLQQCLAAMSATGGDCAVNPRYTGDPVQRVRPRFRSLR